MSSGLHRRGPWSQSEDNYLIQLVHSQGALNWVRIAQLLGSRSPKQCRERYHQNLKPSLNHDPITPEEGVQIERLVGEIGKRWAEIARRLHGRSDNAVKNWWNGSMNRRRRLVRRKNSSHSSPGPEDHDPVYAPRPATAANGQLYLSAPSYTTPSRYSLEASLPSPSVSVTSRAESVDAAPSLISDSGSNWSSSPRGVPSPVIELPPLSSLGADIPRPVLPALHQFSHGASCQASSESHPNNKLHILSSIASPTYRRQELPTAPPTPVHLPALQLKPSAEVTPASSSRMHLSSLLN